MSHFMGFVAPGLLGRSHGSGSVEAAQHTQWPRDSNLAREGP